jgi:NAD(P)-dependent dehydrogenase (short-subunit alcohol dehydrogenase family)
VTTTVITGSSTGIGYAAALRLARDGHHVIATMRNPDACDLEVVAKEQNLDIDVKALDVNSDESVDELFAEVLGSHGVVDVLVNNAGVGGGGSVVEETPLEVFQDVMNTNYFGALRCMNKVLPGMREKGSGTIVNVTSQAGRFCAPGMGPYNASKYALEAASETLAVEVAQFGIRVAIIEPGLIMTPIWNKVDLTPPTGPYAPIRNRLGSVVMGEMRRGGSPSEVVADCIAEAITTDTPRLRWLTGAGAERNVANRNSMSDEEWIAGWQLPNDEFEKFVFAE